MNSAHRLLRPAGALRSLALASLATVAVACSYQASGSHTSSGAVTGSGSVEFTDGGVDSATGKPALVFGVNSLAGNREYSYVIVAKPSDAGRGTYSTGMSGEAILESRKYSATHMIELGSSALSVVHSATINGSDDGLTEEKLMIQDKEVDLSLGRLIVLDEWVIRGGWTQLATPLPKVTGTAEDLPASTRAAIEALALTDSDLADFLDR